eukprot:COSAG06_NODE_36205_length_450_cov_0.880342_1_plen_138_part_10
MTFVDPSGRVQLLPTSYVCVQLSHASPPWIPQCFSSSDGLRLSKEHIDDAPELLATTWLPATVQPPPADWEAALPPGAPPSSEIVGFDASGAPATWPLRYGYAGWSATLEGLAPGEYEVRARTVDTTGNAQPQPRPQP